MIPVASFMNRFFMKRFFMNRIITPAIFNLKLEFLPNVVTNVDIWRMSRESGITESNRVFVQALVASRVAATLSLLSMELFS
jgi:hypothetical protein